MWLTIIFAFLITALIFLFSYYALFGAVRLISLSDMRAAFRYNIHDDKELAPSIEEEVEDAEASSHASNPSLAAQLFSPEKVFPEDDSLRARFQHLMVDEQLFLQPSLTLTEVSERLHSNKTYVSKMVNNTYNRKVLKQVGVGDIAFRCVDRKVNTIFSLCQLVIVST